jgi:hypothetical protein
MKSGVQPWILCGCHSLPASSAAPAGSATHNFQLRPRRFQHPTRTAQSATGAVAGDEPVEPVLGEVLQNLRARGGGVIARIGLIVELTREERAVLQLAKASAIRTMPLPRSAAGVRITFAPSARISLRRSIEKVSLMKATKG